MRTATPGQHRVGELLGPSRPKPWDLLRVEQGKNRPPSAASGGHVRAHDLSRTAASYMGEAGVDRFHIAYVLNHRSITNSFAATGGVPVPGDICDGAMINHPDVDLADPEWIRPAFLGTLYFKSNYAALQQVERRWDPRNVFHHALSIRP